MMLSIIASFSQARKTVAYFREVFGKVEPLKNQLISRFIEFGVIRIEEFIFISTLETCAVKLIGFRLSRVYILSKLQLNISGCVAVEKLLLLKTVVCRRRTSVSPLKSFDILALYKFDYYRSSTRS